MFSFSFSLQKIPNKCYNNDKSNVNGGIMKNTMYRYFIVALGSIIMGVSINTFFVQHNLLSGGITGIAVMLYYLFNLPIGITSFILNIPLFFVAYRYMNREFFIITLLVRQLSLWHWICYPFFPKILTYKIPCFLV